PHSLLLFFPSSRHHPALHSFPTRRSSDLLVPLDKIPRQLVNALVAIEDSRFFEHRGLDFVGIARAAITNLASGKIRQGASTITQDRKSTRLNSSHVSISYAVFCLKKKKKS